MAGANASNGSNAWGYAETVLVLDMWADDEIQHQLDMTPNKNIHVYREIASKVAGQLDGFDKSGEECRGRIKRLKVKYYKIKHESSKSGAGRNDWVFFEKFDAVLGRRPSLEPVKIIDSFPEAEESDEGGFAVIRHKNLPIFHLNSSIKSLNFSITFTIYLYNNLLFKICII